MLEELTILISGFVGPLIWKRYVGSLWMLLSHHAYPFTYLKKKWEVWSVGKNARSVRELWYDARHARLDWRELLYDKRHPSRDGQQSILMREIFKRMFPHFSPFSSDPAGFVVSIPFSPPPPLDWWGKSFFPLFCLSFCILPSYFCILKAMRMLSFGGWLFNHRLLYRINYFRVLVEC